MMDVIGTDYGVVNLTPKVTGYLSAIDPNWREIAANKRKRGKHARYIRERIAAVEQAVNTLAGIEWCAGNVLESV